MRKIYIAILLTAILSEIINMCTVSSTSKDIDNPELVSACKNEAAFTDYLSDTLATYISEKVQYTIDTRTCGIKYDDEDIVRSVQMFRLLGSVFLDEDSIRVTDWNKALSKNGLHHDSIAGFINRHIDFYNKRNPEHKMNHASIAKVVNIEHNPAIFDKICKMETIAVWEIFDIAGVGLAGIELIIGIPIYLVLMTFGVRDDDILTIIKIPTVALYILSIMLFIRLFHLSSMALHETLIQDYTNIICSSLNL